MEDLIEEFWNTNEDVQKVFNNIEYFRNWLVLPERMFNYSQPIFYLQTDKYLLTEIISKKHQQKLV